MNGKLGSGKRFAKLEHSLAHRPGIRDAKAVAASIGRKKFGNKGMENLAEKGHLAMGGDAYARGGSVNEKLHPGYEPGGLNVGSMVTAILRRRTGSQAPQLMAEGGAVDPREAQRQRERQQANQEFVNEHAAGGPPTGASGSMNERLRQRETERNQEDEDIHSQLAYGGEVDSDGSAAVDSSDFLALEGTDGMGEFAHQGMDPENAKLRRRRILGEIMDDLAAEHYGRV